MATECRRYKFVYPPGVVLRQPRQLNIIAHPTCPIQTEIRLFDDDLNNQYLPDLRYFDSISRFDTPL